jgi:putative redox protein
VIGRAFPQEDPVTTEYVVEAVHRGGMHFSGAAGGYEFHMDYPIRDGDATAGAKPMEMLLASLASCAGGSLAALMRRAGQAFDGLTVTARGQRRSEHPTIFTEIALEVVVQGQVDPAVVQKVMAEAESRVCPIWAMLRASTPIASSFRIASGVAR